VFAALGVSVIKTTTAEVRDGGIDVRDLLVKASLGQADFSDLLQQTLEVILVEKCAIFHALPSGGNADSTFVSSKSLNF
jgi:hypothetical protein